jgi:hypothetical protein
MMGDMVIWQRWWGNVVVWRRWVSVEVLLALI